MNYTDLHCHILPGVDDGAKTLADAQKMLKIAYSEGIRSIFLTPHYYPGQYMIEREDYERSFAELSAWQKENMPELTLYRGNEVCLGRGDVSEAIYGKQIFSMAGSNYLLVEFDTDISLDHMKRELYRVIGMGLWPILAHVERYECLNRWRLDSEVPKLAYFQINASSVLGQFGASEMKFARKLLKKGMVHFLGTDAHSTGRRSPRMHEAAEVLRETYDSEMVERILYTNPAKVIAGEKI